VIILLYNKYTIKKFDRSARNLRQYPGQAGRQTDTQKNSFIDTNSNSCQY
jgi:hypothetical protein